MSIRFACECGHVLKAPDGSAGQQGKCRCGRIVTIPDPASLVAADPEPIFGLTDFPSEREPSAEAEAGYGDSALPASEIQDDVPESYQFANAYEPSPTPAVLAYAAPGRRAAGDSALIAPSTSSLRRYFYWALLMVFIPLAWSTLHKGVDENPIPARVQQIIAKHPEVLDRLIRLGGDADKHDVFAVFPDDRLEGAFLPENTWAHWLIALASAAGFISAILLLFPTRHTRWQHLVGIGLLTGTIGILLLLGFQWVAFHVPLVTGRGIIALLIDLVWLVGQSYSLALGDHGFFLSFLGFTAGVGFCEEVCKALPLIFKSGRSGFVSWRSAMLWGLISGVGFGVSEGITYSTDYYNGVSGVGAYLVRFVSCVGLHAIWSAAVGITIFRRQDMVRERIVVALSSFGNILIGIVCMAQVVIVPMMLHGLYDTLLKQDHDGWALLVALASFGWLAAQIEMAERQFADNELGETVYA